MSSVHVELAELRDDVIKLTKLNNRVRAREGMAEMRERRAAVDVNTADKATLRRIAGITPGQYPKHGD